MRSGGRTSGISSSVRRETRNQTSGSSWSFPRDSPPRRSGRRLSSMPIPPMRARRSSTCFSATAAPIGFRSRRSILGMQTTNPSISASTCRKGCSRNTPVSAAVTATISRRTIATTKNADCDGRWSTARRRDGATAKATIPT